MPMRAPLPLLSFIGQAVVHSVKGGLPVGDFVLDVLPDIAHEVWDQLKKEGSDDARLRATLEGLAKASADEVRQTASTVAEDAAIIRPAAYRQALAVYLTQVPVAIRHWLRRPEDPAGITVGDGLLPRQAEDLVGFLPLRLPRFK